MIKQCKVCHKYIDFGSNVNATTCAACLSTGYKYCSQCATVKPLSDFKIVGKSAKGDTRYSGECKVCAKQRSAKYYTDNAEHIKEQTNAYRLRHLDKYVKYTNMYKERHPHERHTQMRAANKKYRLSPKGSMKIKHSNAVYGRMACLGDLTAVQWQRILELFDFKCAYCGGSTKLTMEHLLPVSKGGALTASNIVVACQHCNSSRGNRDLADWLSTIDDERKAKIIWYINEGHKSIE